MYKRASSIGPPIGHYTPHFSVVMPKVLECSVTPQTYGVIKRRAVKPKKECLDHNECTLDKRILVRLKEQRKSGNTSVVDRSVDSFMEEKIKRNKFRPMTAAMARVASSHTN